MSPPMGDSMSSSRSVSCSRSTSSWSRTESRSVRRRAVSVSPASRASVAAATLSLTRANRRRTFVSMLSSCWWNRCRAGAGGSGSGRGGGSGGGTIDTSDTGAPYPSFTRRSHLVTTRRRAARASSPGVRLCAEALGGLGLEPLVIDLAVGGPADRRHYEDLLGRLVGGQLAADVGDDLGRVDGGPVARLDHGRH